MPPTFHFHYLQLGRKIFAISPHKVGLLSTDYFLMILFAKNVIFHQIYWFFRRNINQNAILTRCKCDVNDFISFCVKIVWFSPCLFPFLFFSIFGMIFVLFQIPNAHNHLRNTQKQGIIRFCVSLSRDYWFLSAHFYFQNRRSIPTAAGQFSTFPASNVSENKR